MRVAFVPFEKDLRPEAYRDIFYAALSLAYKTTKDENYLKDPAKIRVIERDWAVWDGKLFPGGQSTAWAMRFSQKKNAQPQIIKCFFNLNPYLLVNHVASAEKFLLDFPTPIPVKEKEYLVKPAKNIALARIENEGRFIFHLQLFSKGSIIPPSLPIGEVCKVISMKGYVVDAYPRNWRLSDEKGAKCPVIEYIDQLYWNKIYQQQERIQALTEQLDKYQYAL